MAERIHATEILEKITNIIRNEMSSAYEGRAKLVEALDLSKKQMKEGLQPEFI